VPNPIQPLIENLLAYPVWLSATCAIVVLIGVVGFFFRIFRFVIVIALVIAGLILAVYVAMQVSN
jgi:hypothetical protein